MANRGAGLTRYALLAIVSLAAALDSFDAGAQLAPHEDATATLAAADAGKTAKHDAFLATLERVGRSTAQLTRAQLEHLRYLEAWQVAYAGHYDEAVPLLEAVVGGASDKTLRFRATATLINILGIGHRYQDAFSRLADLLDTLPDVQDPQARYVGLAEAAQMLTAAGQHDLAVEYAERTIREKPAGESLCKATYIQLHALYRGKKIDGDDPRFAQGVATCEAAGENLVANSMRADVADSDIARGKPAAAIAVLEPHYADVLTYRYPNLTSQIESSLAQAHREVGDPDDAQKYALAAVASSVPGEFSEPLGNALRTLYLVAKQRGDFQAATQWLERYMQADKGYLDDVSARALAYEAVKQQVASSRMEADALDRQNQILHLQREVDRRSMESSRLYIVLLLTIVAGIALWLLRTKRSQLRFMRMARRDSLTGICNRQHFVERSTQLLQGARRTNRPCCLILFDLDHFKLVNDTFGHAEGDWVLLRVVAECRDHLLEGDVFGRLGGEEFAILLPDADEATGMRRAEMIRAAFAAGPVGSPSSARVTASFGVACTTRHGDDLDRLLGIADEALYRGKGAGRDRVILAMPIDENETSYEAAPVASTPHVQLARQ